MLGLHDEVNILRKIRHPSILQLYEIFESDANIHLIIEFLEGKELFEQIKQRGQYQEKDAATIIKCILNALVVLHSNNIVHRDLKPENLIFRNEDLSSLVIIDFGLSTMCKGKPLTTRCGSPGYVAPEILNNLGYGCKADIFSVGVIMYILLTSKFVFNAKEYSEILRRNKTCKISWPSALWNKLSPEAMDICKKMLQKNPDDRVSAVDAVNHPWFKMHTTTTDEQVNIYNQQEKVQESQLSFTEEEMAQLLKSPLGFQKSDLATSSPLLFSLNRKKK